MQLIHTTLFTFKHYNVTILQFPLYHWTSIVRFPNPLALGNGLAGNFSFRPSSTKKCKSDIDNGVLIGFVIISGRLMPNHKFFHSLVPALAPDFFPPPYPYTHHTVTHCNVTKLQYTHHTAVAHSSLNLKHYNVTILQFPL